MKNKIVDEIERINQEIETLTSTNRLQDCKVIAPAPKPSQPANPVRPAGKGVRLPMGHGKVGGDQGKKVLEIVGSVDVLGRVHKPMIDCHHCGTCNVGFRSRCWSCGKSLKSDGIVGFELPTTTDARDSILVHKNTPTDAASGGATPQGKAGGDDTKRLRTLSNPFQNLGENLGGGICKYCGSTTHTTREHEEAGEQ